jgi:hypothetical protein
VQGHRIWVQATEPSGIQATIVVLQGALQNITVRKEIEATSLRVSFGSARWRTLSIHCLDRWKTDGQVDYANNAS